MQGTETRGLLEVHGLEGQRRRCEGTGTQRRQQRGSARRRNRTILGALALALALALCLLAFAGTGASAAMAQNPPAMSVTGSSHGAVDEDPIAVGFARAVVGRDFEVEL